MHFYIYIVRYVWDFLGAKVWILVREQATGWKLEEAIQLFYVGHEGAAVAPPTSHSPPTENFDALADQPSGCARFFHGF